MKACKLQYLVRPEMLVVVLCLFAINVFADEGFHGFQYLSPKPGSFMVSPSNNIILRPGDRIDQTSLRGDLISVIGSQSGNNAGRVILSDDVKTIVFLPAEPFLHSEQVNVTLNAGLRSESGITIPPVTFSFSIRKPEPPDERRFQIPFPAVHGHGRSSSQSVGRDPSLTQRLLTTGCDSLPPSYPSITLDALDNPEPGEVFISPFYFSEEGHLIIMDNSGVPVFYRRLPFRCIDFKAQTNGTLTYFPIGDPRFIVLDASYTVIDSFLCGNGYETDGHELVVLENGHALLMSYDYQTINMDSLVAGGDTAATVIGLIIQELDLEKNVVFQWSSWDHISILDGAVSGYVVLDSSFIDYIHGNAIELDTDGNLMVSSRHLNEITKIDRQTGDIIWRLGLNALHNDFTFTNDPRGWSHQHDIRRLENGHISLYDNGNFLNPEYSSALEYALDEQNMTATLVWSHRNNPDVYGPFMGSVRHQSNGGAIIGWGGTEANVPGVTEIHADGSTALQLSFPDNHYTYRAFRSPWRTTMFSISPDSVVFGTVSPGDSSLQSLVVSNGSTQSVEINCFANSEPSFSVLSTVPITIPPGSNIGLTLKFKPLTVGEFMDRLYVRSVNDTQLVAQVVVLSGRTDSVTSVVDEGTLPLEHSLKQNYPNPFNPSTTIEYSLPRAEHVRLEVFNPLGEQVALLRDQPEEAGNHSVVFRPEDLPSGVYFYRLKAGSFVETMKLLLLR